MGPIVACANGLLRIRDRAVRAHTPGFFNQVSVPFAYDPNAAALRRTSRDYHRPLRALGLT
ncbi:MULTISPECIES: hypothetical protein [Streptomyces]|uniref:hypothetical protein n=1 Tax=Streptomyces TaxID=1883 RepID=UPI0029BE3E4A|nr:hypothetical protein [Streptomyces sp. WI03-4A]MDX2595937.1 hypothetical protein [Streptomyces sp. WI03-4A]